MRLTNKNNGKKILIITDNLHSQINGVVTTYRNIEICGKADGYEFAYLTPEDFSYIDCPKYNEVKLAYPRQMGKKIEEIAPDYIHIATEGPLGRWEIITWTQEKDNVVDDITGSSLKRLKRRAGSLGTDISGPSLM